jgi:hypothetical protein
MVFSFWMGEQRDKKILGVNTQQTPAIGNLAQPAAQNAS